MKDRAWVVLREGERRRSGGDLRRRYLFDGLVKRTGAEIVDDWKPTSIGTTLRLSLGRRWQPWRIPALVASSELLSAAQLEAVVRYGIASVVDVHDEPLVQYHALGIETPSDEAARLRRLLDDNLEAFRWHVAQSASFAALAGMEPARTLVAPNGCDPGHVAVRPVPDVLRVGFVSGAAPGRGIETLIEAARLARTEIKALELQLWLVATGDATRAYLETLTASVAGEPWITIGGAPYRELGAALGSASVLVIPTPQHAYWDTVIPVKLLDSMAAGRPLVVTPRTEMAAIVERRQAGLVARGDTAADLAEPIVRLARDPALRTRLGANARAAAEEEFSWDVISARLAAELLARRQPWRRRSRRPVPAR